MNKKRFLLILQSVLCVMIVILLSAAAIGIYREGLVVKEADPLSWIYTREKVAAALGPILPLLVFSLLVTLIGLFTGIRDENADRPVQDTQLLRDLTVARVAAPGDGMKRERVLQKRLLYGGWALFALCMVPVLIYITNGDHFPNGDLESMFLALIGHVLPWIALGIAALMISTVLQEKSMRREIEAAREQIRLEKAEGVRPPEADKKEPETRGGIRLLRAALLILAVTMIVAGAFNGSATDVFGKAVKICTECIGLG